jgi:hypothetical protein
MEPAYTSHHNWVGSREHMRQIGLRPYVLKCETALWTKYKDKMDPYITWLNDSKHTLYKGADILWRPYQKALVPASLRPEPIELNADQARELLQDSGALLLRYFTRTSERPTDFWYTACSEYNFKNLVHKVRTQIRRAYKDCRVEPVDPVWLADNGYKCYTAAFAKYRNAQPESRAEFDAMCRGSEDGPFDFWGVFVGEKLVGFAKYAVGEDYAAGLVIKLDPRFLSLSPSAALQDTILTKYVAGQGKTVFGGFRSLVHDTNMHDFLLKFGYRRIYCDLKLVYRPSLRIFVKLSYPLRALADHIPESRAGSKVRSLLKQEEIHRSFESGGKYTTSLQSVLHRILCHIWANPERRPR